MGYLQTDNYYVCQFQWNREPATFLAQRNTGIKVCLLSNASVFQVKVSRPEHPLGPMICVPDGGEPLRC